MEVGKRIAELRKENRMSQEQFGQLFHVTRQTVSNWENAKSYPDLQTLVKISELFEITMDELLKENAPMVQKIDKERKAGKLFRNLFIAAGIILLLLVFVLPVLSPMVTPEEERNVSYADYKLYMYLNFPEAAPSRAIVRTFEKEEFDHFSEARLRQIYEITDGKMEGDAPPFHLQGKGETLWVVMQNYSHKNITLDEPPIISLKLYGIYDSAAPVWEQQSVMTAQACGGYSWWMENPYAVEGVGTEPDYKGQYIRRCHAEIQYKINGVEYVSVTSFYLFYTPEESEIAE